MNSRAPGLTALLLLAGLAGCEDAPPRPAGTRFDAGEASATDAARFDAEVTDTGWSDAGSLGLDAAPKDGGAQDAGAWDASAADAEPVDAGAPDTGPAEVCGDGVLQGNETCDDGRLASGCDTYHDGGDGLCVPPGQCATGYILDRNGDCVVQELSATVIIDVSNTCVMAVTPTEITVPSGQSVLIDWYNRSVDYPVDVWLSYGGGYLDLAPGTTWDEPISHCTGPNPHNEYADISTACSSFRFYFRCQ